MIFAGPYLSPTAVLTPGQIPPAAVDPNRVRWGEDVEFQVADPGENCTMAILIKTGPEETTPDLSQSYERTEDAGDISFLFKGVDVRKFLMPGIYRFQVVKIVDTGTPPLKYAFLNEGMIEVIESAGSLFVPESDADPDIPDSGSPYVVTEMILFGSTAADQVFGFYRSPSSNLEIVGYTILAQTPPDGADLVLSLVDEDSNVVATGITLPDGQDLIEISLDENSLVPVAPATGLRCKVVSTGSNTAAENVTIRVRFRQAS